MRRLGVLLALAYLSTAALLRRLAGLAGRDGRRDDRGEGPLTTAVMAVGLVLIAGVILLILRAKAIEAVNRICTAADPTTCR
jgi:hypothetical protein